jgi:hypothetical protein
MADITTTQTSAYPSWAANYAQGYLGRAQQVADSPYQAYTGQRVADFAPWQQQGLQAQAQRAMSGSPVMNAANAALPGMFQGGGQAAQNQYGPVQAQANPYAGSNPYLTQQIDAAQGDVVRNWNNVQKPQWDTSMQRSGSFGNSGIAQANQMAQSDMQRNLGQISSGMRFQDYTQQQQLGENAANRALQAGQFNATMGENYAGRQDSMYNQGQGRALSALGMAPSFAQQDYNDIGQLQQAGAAYQGQNQKLLDSGYQQFLDSRNYPAQQLDIFGNALTRAVGNQGTQTSTQPGTSTGASVVGGLLTGSALYKMLTGG